MEGNNSADPINNTSPFYITFFTPHRVNTGPSTDISKVRVTRVLFSVCSVSLYCSP